jgi:beta-N-acetylhexosaminidase
MIMRYSVFMRPITILYTIFFLILGGFLLYSSSLKNTRPDTAADPLASTPSPTETPPLETMIGQLFIIGHWAHTPLASTTALLQEHHLGGVVIMSVPENPATIKEWVTTWQEAAEIPLIIAIDQEGGPVSRLRGENFNTVSQRAITDTTIAYQTGVERGNELAALGITMNFAPVLEHATKPDSFLYERVFPSTTDSAALASALLSGMSTAGVTGVIKHFPGHPDTPIDSHVTLPQVPITLSELDSFTAPFRTLFTTTPPAAIMTAHVQFPLIDEKPATLSYFFLTSYLRETLGYQGLIITDDVIMQAIANTTDSSTASGAAIAAGADIVLFAAEPEKVVDAIAAVHAAVGAGTLPQERIATSYNRITTFKHSNQTAPTTTQ